MTDAADPDYILDCLLTVKLEVLTIPFAFNSHYQKLTKCSFSQRTFGGDIILNARRHNIRLYYIFFKAR